MKTLQKTEDQAMDNLLRSHIAQQGKSSNDCRGFDPDIANAYIERSLTTMERNRYEDHLSACGPCRTSVVALAQMAEMDFAPARIESAAAAPAREIVTNRLSGFRSLLAGLAMPRTALAAVALLVLVVSIPLYLSRKDAAPGESAPQLNGELAQADKGEGDSRGLSDKIPSAPAPENIAAQGVSSNQEVVAQETTVADQRKQDEAAGRRESEAAQPAAASEDKVEAPEPPRSQPVDPNRANERAEGIAAGRIAAAAQTPPPPPAPPAAAKEETLERIDSATSLRTPKGKDSADMKVIQPAHIASEPKREQDDTTIKPGDVVPPPTQTRADESRERKAIASNTPGTPLVESRRNSSRPSGSPERKVGNKKFYKLNDVWTDKDYNPAKERPEVTIIRDSDIYNEMIAKHRTLKLYFTNFAKDEQAIIVYKNTVYKLKPKE